MEFEPQTPSNSASAACQAHHSTENGGIRQLQLGEGGTFEDLELVSVGESFEGIVGAIGVAP